MQYPAWKYLLITVVLFIAGLYAAPNLYPDEPAVQITSAAAGTQLSEDILTQSQSLLEEAGINFHDGTFEGNSALVRLNNPTTQLKAQEVLRQNLGDNYVVALNLAQTTPQWLRDIGAKPMKLGLDLRGGVRFVLEVDMDKALEQRLTSASRDVRRELRAERIAVKGTKTEAQGIVLHFADTDARNRAQNVLQGTMGTTFNLQSSIDDQGPSLIMAYNDATIDEINSYAVNQNLTTLRNRIAELGVTEALVQSQGASRIVVELPGVQDTAEAKRVLGRTANLEFRLVAKDSENFMGGIPPAGTEAFPFKTLDGQPVLLERQAIVTGDKVTNAQTSLDESGRPEVNITLIALAVSSCKTPRVPLSVSKWRCCLLKTSKKSLMKKTLLLVKRSKYVHLMLKPKSSTVPIFKRYWAHHSVLLVLIATLKLLSWRYCYAQGHLLRRCTSLKNVRLDLH